MILYLISQSLAFQGLRAGNPLALLNEGCQRWLWEGVMGGGSDALLMFCNAFFWLCQVAKGTEIKRERESHGLPDYF